VILDANCTRIGYSEPLVIAYDKVSESIKLNWKQSGKLALELEAAIHLSSSMAIDCMML
jgi:hypothetical protein